MTRFSLPILNRLSSSDWLAIGLLLLYTTVFSYLTIGQHNSFNTNALDLAKFDQGIWNTSQGRPFRTTIGEDLVIQSHFSPALALFAPLFWLWPNVRILFIAQSLLMAGAGFLIYWNFRRSAPWLGLVVFAAYLMHPALHHVNLEEFRRITLAAFATSFALYHLLRRQYGWMALGLAVCLLCKEDMSLVVLAFGLYIVIIQKNVKVGLIATFTGLAWFFLVPFYLLPQLNSFDQVEGYQHAANLYGYLGDTLPEILASLTSRPQIIWDFAGRPERWTAVFNFLWPSAFLFLLAPEVALFIAPQLVLLLASTSSVMGRLGGWYTTVLTIILYWSVGLGVYRLPQRWREAACAVLLIASAGAWISRSDLWPGSQFEAARFTVDAHEHQVLKAIREIPQEAIVMAQDPIAPHLAHRQELYVLPWVRGGNRPEYVIFDREMRTYPVGADAYRTLFYDYLAGTEYEIDQQIDSFYVFKDAGAVSPQQKTKLVWPEHLQLEGLTIEAALPGEPYSAELEQLPAGATVRVALFWKSLGKMDKNYTVFVHALNEDGALLGQHDSWPADAHRPTSVLQPEEKFRDVHYITLSAPVAIADLVLRVGVYDSVPGEALQDSNGQEFALIPPG